ncbi:C-type lectin 1-like [Littorina saxatilis]|uniref:C-type lectin 1-like n=1 Tax=Littorina saxatilis TaxID=31220 RepID=UPI0038B534D9
MSLKMWTVGYYCAVAMVVIAVNIQLRQAVSTNSADLLDTATCRRDDIKTLTYTMMSFTNVDADDFMFKADVLFEVHTTSEEDCARQCIRHEVCITFTFMTPQGLCRGHKVVMSRDDSYLFSPLARSFVHTKALLCGQLEGYSWQVGHCVRPFDVTVSADDAQQMCIQHGGGHLIHLKTAGQLQLIECIFDKMGWDGKFAWVGADDKQVEGEFRWSDGSLLPISSALWEVGQPNNAHDLEHCVGIESTSRLFDRRCNGTDGQRAPFVCQVDL